ncbi:hypothetical protein [Alishewanella sp. SMS8]|uniref:hypothetical protein n=1 Tax=Alishewanella sp. SMS8 TaxID=2994676 RepID=UPI002740C209|nr:hypothetical protein [Alishewanella sp. SMS8]MDP5205795.1 hypothetical protein [Alishewanella sp. SMS9]MDP5459887.1 hypothetical protein [Alishewanella sp. SMS8]
MNSIDDAALFLQDLSADSERALADTLNAAAARLRQDAINAISGRYNLDRSYVAQNMTVRTRANPKNLESIISARMRGTMLSRFGATQQYKAGKTVPQRTAGVSVNVVRTNPTKTIEQAFLIRLKRGDNDGGNLGVAIRNSKNRNDYRILYGMSVHQAFNWYRDELEPSNDDLFDDFISRLTL